MATTSKQQAQETTGRSGPRCPACWGIRRRHAQALESDDLHTAVAMTVAMGRHLRAAHS
ncbi:hypothetical protein [Streptomyces cinnamoneus]|uniref:hypothetical protein n=1 Tax=Streptomyces cinnamoneus TaxID=53446 RepID=UPI0015E31696|nr:hypothetical protein [Streptomyces cinnamoneus]